MDPLIERFDGVADRDLMLCPGRGIAYQRTADRVEYGDAYYGKVLAYEDSEIARKVNDGRNALLSRHLKEGAKVLDWGAGTGAFVRAARSWGFAAMGFDIMPRAVDQLSKDGLFETNPDGFEAVTLWDSLEHLEDPQNILAPLNKGVFLFVSIPIFADLARVRESKHYRPGEHLYYFTALGLVDWMALHGYRLLEQSDHEEAAGRDSIVEFAFVKDLPDYHDHILAYREMHATRFYGSSATELHLDTVAKVVKELGPKSILDYGCGRSDLVAHFWMEGRRRLERFDPAIAAFKRLSIDHVDLVLCTDVMEHIPMASVDRVLAEIKAKGTRALFTISTKLARAKLPDGRNAHVTLLSPGEWTRWIGDVFGLVRELPSKFEHELILLAGPK